MLQREIVVKNVADTIPPPTGLHGTTDSVRTAAAATSFSSSWEKNDETIRVYLLFDERRDNVRTVIYRSTREVINLNRVKPRLLKFQTPNIDYGF